jgi:hypothetical protein
MTYDESPSCSVLMSKFTRRASLYRKPP